MNKIIKTTDGFLINHKNKIMLISIAFLLLCCICYFTVSADKVSMKGFMVLLISTVFLSMFYGIKLLLHIRNRLMPMNRFAGYIFDMLFVLLALFVIIAFLYDFILTSDGFSLIIFSVMSGFLNAIIFARVKNPDREKNKTK